MLVAALLTLALVADDPADRPLAAARAALEAGNRASAAQHLAVALAHAPFASEPLELALEAAALEADARALWGHDWWSAAADETGRAKPDATVRKLLDGDDAQPGKVAAARASAVRELSAFAAAREKRGRKEPGELLVARWARRLALELARPSPALAATIEALDPRLVVPERYYAEPIRALQHVLGSALANRETGLAMRAARVLTGLGAQADFKDLKGPVPKGMGKVRRAGQDGLARARAQLGEKAGEPWTVDELEWLTDAEGEAFTREHDSFANPGLALTPREWYRVETDCGYQTLLGVARTLELHHERLAGWYGVDPFVGRPGICRIVPEATGLEAEGAPFWWVGGFQGGDVTTFRFSTGTIEGLGHGLTHELTHRFDGVLFPGQPAWLSEGKAVWTADSYGASTDETFVDMKVSFGTIESAFIKGYGGAEKLQELIEGTIEDYRDNYVAGYALYVYLRTWEDGGERLFADGLQTFMEDAERGSRDWFGFFQRLFCDGEQGRPDTFEAFAERFKTFVQGFYWQDRKPFTERYVPSIDANVPHEWVYDEPTWVWSRRRAEPVFGEGLAALGAQVLLDAGRRDDALHAFVWALSTDGRRPEVEATLARVLGEAGEKSAAWVLTNERRGPFGSADDPPPFVNALPRTKAFVAALEAASSDYAERGLERASAALSADRDRVAARLGREALGRSVSAAPKSLHPFDPPARHLGLAGWVEDDLTDYEEKRVENLWFVDGDAHLHVGRKRPRAGTGRLDRAAHERHAFARSSEWIAPGAYRLRTRIRFTTSYANGAIVLGFTRRDRNVRIRFNAGSFLYSIGESEKEPTFESVGWRIDGLRERERPLGGSLVGGEFQFDEGAKPAVDVELVVDGSTLHLWLDGERVGTYHTTDGAPIEGHVGFATSNGAIQVQDPVLSRLDRARFAGTGDVPLGLDLVLGESAPFDELANRPTRGFDPPSQGLLVLWIPFPELDEGDELDIDKLASGVRRRTKSLVRFLNREDATQPFVVVVPRAIGADGRKVLGEWFEASLEEPPRLLLHEFVPTPPEFDTPDLGRRWLFFVDPTGVVRVAAKFSSQVAGFDDRLSHWLTVFRDHGRPPRELPPVERPPAEEEDAEGE